MPAFDRDGIHFNYVDTGTGLPFVFQHGLGGDVNQPLGFFADVLQASPPFRMISLDCRGHGETRPLGPESKLTLEQFADDLVALLDDLEVSQIVVGGISMGAAVSLNLALRYPERIRGLILSRPAWLDRPDPENLAILKHVAALIREHGCDAGRERFLQSTEYAAIVDESPDVAQSLLSQFEHPRAVETVAKLERIPADSPCRDRAQWAGIAAPTLVLANRQDPIHPFSFGEILAAAIPGAELREVTPKSVDVSSHEKDVRTCILDFINRRIDN